MSSLADEEIKLNRKGDPCLDKAEAEALLGKISEWSILHVDGADRLERKYEFRDYLMIIDLAHKIGRMAEQANHHPVMQVEWGKLSVTWWTHSIGGLARNDFVMAAKCDRAAMLVSAP